jgi:hypothetical protein
MLSSKIFNKLLNLNLHILILFIFLTIYFFTYVAIKEKEKIDTSLNTIINDQTISLLSQLDKWDKKLSPTGKSNINWDNVEKNANKLKNKYIGEIPSIKSNNKKLLIISIISICVILFIFIGMLIYTKIKKNELDGNINIKHIIIENVIIFIFVGIIELLFFQFIINKYIPIGQEFVVTEIVNKLKSKINNNIKII